MLHYQKTILSNCFGRDVNVVITEINGLKVIRVLNGDGCLTHARRHELYTLLMEHKVDLKVTDWLNVAFPRLPGYPAKFWGPFVNYDIDVNYLEFGSERTISTPIASNRAKYQWSKFQAAQGVPTGGAIKPTKTHFRRQPK